MHESISLLPLNPDYQPIVLSESDVSEFRVIGELVGVL